MLIPAFSNKMTNVTLKSRLCMLFFSMRPTLGQWVPSGSQMAGGSGCPRALGSLGYLKALLPNSSSNF